MLSDAQLEEEMLAGRLRIAPEPEARALQPASIDLRLAGEFMRHQTQPPLGPGHSGFIDPRRDRPEQHKNPELVKIQAASYILEPLSFCLARTIERVALHPTLAARVEGKSTLGRFGLAIHATAGFIDPGFGGHITLELFNFTQYPIKLSAEMAICQIAVHRLEGSVRRPYGHPGLGSHYQGQTGVTPPR